MKQKKIVILGSTGSIGINALKVIKNYPHKFKVVGLTAYNNFKLLEKQIHEYNPSHIAIGPKGQEYFKRNLNGKKINILDGESDLEYISSLKNIDLVIIGLSGSRALKPFLSALRAGITVTTANKEALVIAGDIIMREAKKHKARVIPIDSEQSAIFQCLEGHKNHELKKVYLTASGGSLLNIPKSQFDHLSIKQVLNHPKWKMGKKITVDSATLMNKGFEIIEAKQLFNLDVNKIQVIIHPEAVIHSMVEYIDGSIIAQLGITDMRLPIQYALSYPHRWDSYLKSMNFFELKRLNFEKPNLNKFPSLALAIYTARKGGTLPSVLNASNEEAVEAFLKRKINFSKIYKTVEKVTLKHKIIKNPNLKEILDADQWARQESQKVLT